MSKLQPVRGTHDILPEEARERRFLIDQAWKVAEGYGYGEIIPPIFEFTEVFQRTLGDTSDVVTKETYSFTDRGGESITLRPELTASIARAFLSHGLKDQLPLKYFYYGPAFRYERPQKGRQRQFYQVGAELLGVAEAQGDIEIITMAHDMLSAFGLGDKVTLEMNSLGDDESRTRYREALVEYFSDHRTTLSEESKIRLEKNPLRILDSKDEGDRKLIAAAPAMKAQFTQSANDFSAQVEEGLRALGIPFQINDRLVRGLDYYSHTVFEFTTELLGAQNTVLAGGRYDKLIPMMGGPETPGIGFAAGVERLLLLVDFLKLEGFRAARRPIAIIPVGETMQSPALKIAHDLRRAGHAVELGYRGNLSKRMKKANGMNAVAALMVGEEEWARGVVAVRNLDDGSQIEVAIANLTGSLEHYRDL